MNKTIKFGLVAVGICLSSVANAQYQITNGDFESGWEKCYPWEAGKYGTTAYGTQPTGWCVSNVPNSLADAVGNNVTGYNSNSAVQIINTSAVGNGIPGYMTLGTTWATAETKMTDTRNKDGGVFGGISFTHRPDAIYLVYKRDNSASTSDVSTVVVYTWKGSTSQAEVPSNTAVGVFSWGSATKVTMTNRDNNILGVSTNTGGTVTYSSDFKLLSSTTKTITGSASSWTTLEIPLQYKDATVAPEMMNIVISAAGYLDGGASITDGVSMTVDDVKFLYYSHLTSASNYDESEFEFEEDENGDSIAYVEDSYDASKLKLVSGAGADIYKTDGFGYDEETGEYFVYIEGEDYDVDDNPNCNYYTIKFMVPARMYVSSAAKYGTFCAPYTVNVPEGVTASTLTVKGSTLILDELIYGVIPAWTPVILYNTSGKDIEQEYLEFSEKRDEKSYGLTGAFAETTLEAGDGYVLQNQNGRVGFYPVKSEMTVPAHRAYIEASQVTDAKALYFQNDQETAIKALNALTNGELKEIYSESGARQDKLQKGMNIVKMADGSTQKILVK